MMTRRWFANCAICTMTGLIASGVDANAQTPPPFTRKTLGQQDFPDDKHVVLQMLIEVQPNVLVARHTHPGIETTTLLSGSGTLMVKGQADRVLAPGDGFQIPYGVPHALQCGPTMTRLAGVFAVEKDKPLATPAPE
jgi:quercetin dioxygenase-like cupin family protein